MRSALATFRRLGRGRVAEEPPAPSARAAPPRVLTEEIPLPPLAAEAADEFRALGDEIYRYLVTFCRVRPTHRVLDVGCGYAPAARPLARWLVEGAYDGIDEDVEAITWCRENIASRFPGFRFRALGSTEGRIAYPFYPSVFDAAVLWDVLTRASVAEVEQHVAELARVLRAGRWALLALKLGDVGEAGTEGNERVVHDEARVREILARHELAVVEPIERGRWAGSPDGLATFDLVLVRKPLPKPARATDRVLARAASAVRGALGRRGHAASAAE